MFDVMQGVLCTINHWGPHFITRVVCGCSECKALNPRGLHFITRVVCGCSKSGALRKLPYRKVIKQYN